MSANEIVHRLPHMLFDPRGRVDRKGLLVLALALLALQALFAGALATGLLAVSSAPAILIKLAFLWVALVAASKRLHDLGRSAWWIAITLAAMIVWAVIAVLIVLPIYGQAMLVPGSDGYMVTLALNMLPILAATLWMHFAKGEPVDNRYGPAPDATGFSFVPRQREAAHGSAFAA